MLLAIRSLLGLFTLVAGEPETPFRIARLLYAGDFRGSLNRWMAEFEMPGTVEARDGTLEMDVPAGCTVWFRPELSGAVTIRYVATRIRRGGANDGSRNAAVPDSRCGDRGRPELVEDV